MTKFTTRRVGRRRIFVPVEEAVEPSKPARKKRVKRKKAVKRKTAKTRKKTARKAR